MRIRGWQIEGFGVFHGFEVSDLPRDFILVHGPNEAGKSTLLAFLRAILFGFPDARSSEPAYPPLRGGRHGGALLLEAEDSLYRVERTNGRRARVSITRTDGSEVSSSELERLVGRADRNLFRSVFAFSLAELTELQSLSSDEVRARIFSAGIAGAGRSAREVVVQLDGTIERLLKPRGGVIRELVSRAEDLQRQIREAARKAAEYPELVERENAARVAVERLRAECAAAEAAHRRAVKLVELWPHEAERQRLSASLERLDGTVPDGAAAALAETGIERNVAELNAFDAAASEIEAAIEALGAEIRAAVRDGCASERLSESSSCLAATAGRIAALGDPRFSGTDENWRPRAVALDRVVAEEQRLARAEAVLEAARARLMGIAVDRSLDAIQPAIADVGRQIETARQRLVQLRATSREREDLESAIEREISDLGPGLNEEAVSTLRADLNAVAEIRRMALRMASARAECADRRRDLEHLASAGVYDEQEIARLESVLQGPEPPSTAELSRDAGAIRRLRAALAEMAEVQSRLEGAEALVRERHLALQDVPQVVQTPSWVTSAVVVLSIATMIAAVWRGMSSDPGGSIVLGLVAVAALAILMVTYRSRVKAASLLRPAREARLASLAQAEQQVTRLEERADGLRNRVAEAAADLRLGNEPTGTAIDRREETLERQQEERRAWDRAVEALGRASARRDVWRERMKEAESRVSSAAAAEADAENEWKEWKRRSRLLDDLDPERAIDYLERVRVVQGRIAMRDRLRRCETDLADSAAAWEMRAKELLVQAGETPDSVARDSGESLIDRIAALQARCSRDAERRHERTLISSEIERWQAEAESARSGLAEASRQAAAAIELEWKRLEAAWCDGETWRAARRSEIESAASSRALSDARAKLQQEIERLEGKIEIATGRGDEAEALRAELALGRVDRWEEDKLKTAADVQRLQREHEAAVRAHEVLLQNLKALEEASDVAGFEMELQGVKSEIDQAVRAWTIARLARAMVLRTLAEYERSRQPEVLATASDLMSRVTGGRYTKVVVGDDGESLAIVDRKGARRSVGQLSRGTEEQLYLCIRLGLAREFSRRVEPLPIVMDDVLVDFDTGRAERMALELLRFSKENQVLLFTCHDFTRDLVLRLAPGTRVVELPLEDVPEPAPAAAPPGRPERRRRRRGSRSC